MKNIFRATMMTRHFTFEAYADTAKQARETLIKTLKRHGEQYQCANDWYVEYFDDNLDLREIQLGIGYRDHDTIG